MSRRRQGKSRNRPEIAVICTDRGRHSRARLQRLQDYRQHPEELTEEDITAHQEVCRELGLPEPEGWEPYRKAGICASGPNTFWTSTAAQRVQPNWAPAVMERPSGGVTFVFPCHVCGRSPQLRAENLAGCLDRLYELSGHNTSGVWMLDISYAG